MKCGTAAIVGRPNSGKSTLLNALIRQKISIVSNKPQTTRHRILGILGDSRGQIVFVDTPGIHKPKYRMNERMLRSVRDSLVGVDLVLLTIDGSAPSGAGERYALDLVKSIGARTFLLINKIDKIAKPKLLPIIRHYSEAHEFAEILPISSLTGDNLNLLVERVFAVLPEGPPLFSGDQYTDRTERFLTAEFIREKLLERMREELPYTTAVMLKHFDETRRETKGLVVVEADILVERRSQQGIIVGSGGAGLRDIGTAARLDLERLLGCRVYLGLQVRTAQNWRDDDSILDELELGR